MKTVENRKAAAKRVVAELKAKGHSEVTTLDLSTPCCAHCRFWNQLRGGFELRTGECSKKDNEETPDNYLCDQYEPM